MPYNEVYKWSGHAMMKRVDEFVKQYPSVKVTRVDDHVFAGSYLVFVPVKDMGHYVYYIPQCTGEQPVKFFMYPGHLKSLKKILKQVK